MGSVGSSFQFINYKVDKLKFNVVHSANFLHVNIAADSLNFNFGIRKPTYFKNNDTYVCGIEVEVTTNEPNLEEFNLVVGIAGVFKFIEKCDDSELIEKLVKYQAPALLSPYLRTVVTTVFASAGFGTAIIPLINFYELAKQSLQEIDIIEVL